MRPSLKYAPYFFLIFLYACASEKETEESSNTSPAILEKDFFINVLGDTIYPGEKIQFTERIFSRDTLPKGSKVQFTINDYAHPSGKVFLHDEPVFAGIIEKDSVMHSGPGEIFPLEPRKLNIIDPIPIALGEPVLIRDKKESIYSLTTIQGLPENEVECFAEDQNGGLWVGHFNGVSRIVGDQCFYYSLDNNLDINYVSEIFCSSKNEIWIASNSGLFKYDGRNFWKFFEDLELPGEQFISINEDKDGNIWVGSYYNGLLKVSENEIVHYPVSEEVIFFSQRGIENNENGLILATSLGLIEFDSQSETISQKYLPEPFNSRGLISIKKTQNEDLWMSNWNGNLLKVRNDSVWDYSKAFGSGISAYNIYESEDGSIWFAGLGGGVFHLMKNKAFEVFAQNEGIAENGAGDLLVTNDAVYFNSSSNGLLYKKKNSFHTNYQEDFDSESRFDNHHLDENDNFWSVRRDRSVLLYKDGAQKLFDFSMNDFSTVQHLSGAISPDSGEFMFGSRYGIIHIKDGVGELLGEEQGMIGDYADLIFRDSKGRNWVSTNHSGIFWFNNDEVHQFLRSDDLPIGAASGFFETSNGDIWISNWANGPTKYTDEGFEFITIPNGDENKNTAVSMCFDGDENLWYASQTKLYFQTPKSTHSISSKDGILGGRIYKLMFELDKIWMVTSQGITMLEEVPENIADISFDNYHFAIENIQSLDGLPNLPSRINKFFMNESGKLFWTSSSFISHVDANEYSGFQFALTPQIVRIDLENSISADSIEKSPFSNIPTNLNLNPENNDISFYCAAGEIWNQHEVLFSYKLKGLENDWSSATSDRKITYKNLPPGDYTFMAKAMLENGSWSDEISYPFTIITPWYATTLAKVFYLLFGIFCIYIIVQLRTRKLKKQKERLEWEVEKATHQIQEKHNEIQDSIAYAKRIQLAILPSANMIKKHLPQHYIIYKPKDVVAGDFYWVEENDNETLFAAADCTGHGVPGAMVSVVCHNSLNRAVHEFDLKNPGSILDKARELVVDTFNKNDFQVNDGMDIALCSYNKDQQKLRYSGANNSLYIISDGELNEIKPMKQPIGKYDNPQPFVEHEVAIKKGDSVFLFSDGFADQFGGEKGKKLKYKNFKALLLRISSHPFDKQPEILNDYFDHWKGDFEQLDDVCIMAVKF